MNAALLLGHYARIADASDAIARLRQFVLDLAVRGKLVGQDEGDEPASELLKQIAADKIKLGLKASVGPFTTDKPPFLLPTGWHWTTVGEICSKTGSGSTPRGGKEVYKSSGIPFLRSQNVYDDGLRLDDVAFIDTETHQRMGSTKVLARDLLLNITGGSMGRCCRVPDDFDEANVSQHVAILRLAVCDTEDFLHLLVRSPYFQAFIFEEQTGAGRGGLPKNRMDNITLALPPLAEQKRIVAKVGELMTLCDQLEAARAEREVARDTFTLSTLAKLNTADPETFGDDTRFALANLGSLTARPDQIKQLRQTILNLAVRGKLVQQNQRDEPASQLIGRLLRRDKARRGKGANSNNTNPVGSPFEIPEGWAWATVQQVLDESREISYGVIKLGDEPKNGGIPTLRCSDVRPGFIDLSGVRNVHESIEADYERTRLSGGEVVINIRGTLGGVALVPSNLRGFNVAREVAVVPISTVLPGPFMVYLMLSPYFWDHIQNNLRGIAYKGLNLSILRELPIPLPPLAEQHRIVAKVDELMALCDQLEASIITGEQTRSRLLEAVLHNSLEPA